MSYYLSLHTPGPESRAFLCPLISHCTHMKTLLSLLLALAGVLHAPMASAMKPGHNTHRLKWHIRHLRKVQAQHERRTRRVLPKPRH